MIDHDDLSPDQRAAYDAIAAWFNLGKMAPGQSDRMCLTLGGYAGCGKTTLVALLARELGDGATFAAYTGKATSVLRKKFAALGLSPEVSTLHSLLYKPVELPSGRVHFEPKGALRRRGGGEYKLIVVDEASMVPREMHEMLVAHGVPVLAVGDHGQLPPVFGTFNLMERPVIRLEKIHRQAEGNPILRVAHAVRGQGDVSERWADGERVVFVKDDAGMDRMLERFYGGSPDPGAIAERSLICYTNRVRSMLNAHARQMLHGQAPALVEDGERVVCLRNAWSDGVYNGLQGFMRRAVKMGSDRLRVEFLEEASRDVGPELIVSAHQFGQPKTFQEFEELKKHMGCVPGSWTDVGLLFDYGYALTAHKAQGDQWDEVAVVLPRGGMEHDVWKRWCYTSFSRAVERLWVVVA